MDGESTCQGENHGHHNARFHLVREESLTDGVGSSRVMLCREEKKEKKRNEEEKRLKLITVVVYSSNKFCIK